MLLEKLTSTYVISLMLNSFDKLSASVMECEMKIPIDFPICKYFKIFNYNVFGCILFFHKFKAEPVNMHDEYQNTYRSYQLDYFSQAPYIVFVLHSLSFSFSSFLSFYSSDKFFLFGILTTVVDCQ